MDAIRAGLREELRHSWALFADGTLREAYATEQPTRIVFVLEAIRAGKAVSHLAQLPMIKAGLMTFQLLESRPFANWSRLFDD